MKTRRKTESQLYDPNRDETRIVPVASKKRDARSAYRRDVARLIHSPSFRRLQGKTQLLPSNESDFFRNRLTHSIEVAQIATGIALNLNDSEPFLRHQPINVDLVYFAALAHDIGHAPFGHIGEKVLDHLMIKHGGYEGNAQTLRILTCLEKKETRTFPSQGDVPSPVTRSNDARIGLNLTFRSILSVLKYDLEIPQTRKEPDWKGPVKGYYSSEAALIEKAKSTVVPSYVPSKGKGVRTIECSIMDIADDIAYSTYDLEDALKADFVTALSIASEEGEFKDKVADVVNTKMAREYGEETARRESLSSEQIDDIIESVFSQLFLPSRESESEHLSADPVTLAKELHAGSTALTENAYFRGDFTSKVVHKFMSGIVFEPNKTYPALSKVQLDIPTFKMVETLKRIVYESLVVSPQMKIAEYRQKEILEKIFKTLCDDKEDGYTLLPNDWGAIYAAQKSEDWKKRVVCDFISGMTDRYCVEYYSRIVGVEVPSFHKPF